MKIETGAKNKMPTPLAGGQENSFAPQMIFLASGQGGGQKIVFFFVHVKQKLKVDEQCPNRMIFYMSLRWSS